MNRTYAAELMRRIAPELKGECGVQPILPLEIKLHLERLKLMELVRDLGEKIQAGSACPGRSHQTFLESNAG
jgi:hypothetical protein